MKQNITMNIIIKRSSFYFLLLFFISCEKKSIKIEEIDAKCSFQNLVIDYPNNDSISIRNVETFLLFKNSTDDTAKISLKYIKDNYRHIYKMDTFKIHLEGIKPIFIPPHDSLGVPCMSIIERRVKKSDMILENGFLIFNIKTKKNIYRSFDYNVSQLHDFQLYKKWRRNNGKLTL